VKDSLVGDDQKIEGKTVQQSVMDAGEVARQSRQGRSVTVSEVRELFAYNAWANRPFFAALDPLPAESYFRDLKSSHGGLHGTLCHIVWGEQLWLNRWLGKPNPGVSQGGTDDAGCGASTVGGNRNGARCVPRRARRAAPG